MNDAAPNIAERVLSARDRAIGDVLYAVTLVLYLALAGAAVIVVPGALVMWWLS